MSIFDKVISVSEYAAIKMAEAQHAEGVTVRMNPPEHSKPNTSDRTEHPYPITIIF